MARFRTIHLFYMALGATQGSAGLAQLWLPDLTSSSAGMIGDYYDHPATDATEVLKVLRTAESALAEFSRSIAQRT
jgi:hypothetical protein